MDLALVVLVLAALLTFQRGRRRAKVERTLSVVLVDGSTAPSPERDRVARLARWPWAAGIAATVAGGFVGLQLMGPVGILFAAAGPAIPVVTDRRRRRKEHESLEGQLGDLASTIAMGVRSGLSIPQCLELAADDADPPMGPLLERVLAERGVGAGLGSSLGRLGEAVGTDDARLLVLILLTHAKSGGNLAAALQEVATTIRYRVDARRELRAMTAQGRISGAILGTLPIGFLVLMALTSGNDLGAVYRSPAGTAMVLVGLILEGLAYLWIRSLLRVEA
jgi:tight adherence protein B